MILRDYWCFPGKLDTDTVAGTLDTKLVDSVGSTGAEAAVADDDYTPAQDPASASQLSAETPPLRGRG